MSQILLHHKGVYNFYTTIADGACFELGLTLEQVKSHIKEELGNQGLKNLPDRIKRAQKTGTSEITGISLNVLLLCNRAGKNERKLSTKQFINRFLTLKKTRNISIGKDKRK